MGIVLCFYMNQEQLQYVKNQLQNGIPVDQVRENLTAAGYTSELVEELLQAAESGAAAPPPTATPASLPDVGAFVMQSWAVLRQRMDVTWQTVAIVTGLAALLPILELVLTPGEGTELLLAVVGLISALVSIMLYIAIMRVFFSDTSMSLGEGMRWASSHFFSYIWVAILYGLVSFAGFMLFFIPGVIASIYLLLAPVVWLREDTRGINALVRSTQLIQGNWWAVFFRYFIFILSGFVVVFVVELLSGVVQRAGGLPDDSLWLGIFTAFGSGLLLVASAGALFQVYQGLKDTKPVFTPESGSGLRTFYIIAACLSPFIIGLMIMLVALPVLPVILGAIALSGVGLQ